MSDRLNIGREGENIAEEFLVSKKYSILKRNYRYKRAEIDIIALDTSSNLRIIEVKTRTGQANPEDAVDEKKLKLLFEASSQYKLDNNYECETFFDIIAINLINNKTIIKYFEDVYYEMDFI